MRRPPRDPGQTLFGVRYIGWALLQGALVLALVAGLFAFALHQGLPEGDVRALTFTTLVVANLGLVLVNRSQGASLWAAFRRRNASLWWATAATSIVLALIVALPPVRALFHFGPLHLDDVAIAIGCGIVVLLLLETIKRWWVNAAKSFSV